MTKIVFMGTPAFSVPILKSLVSEGYDVLAVVTQPDRPVGRKRVLTPPPVKAAALELGLDILQPEKISGSTEMERIIELAPDLIVTAAFGQFLPERLLQAPKLGAINVHASLLPKYRGGAPVHYALINGEAETGVTIMEMIKKMDAGDMLSQGRLPITPQDDVGTLFDKLSELGRELLIETLPKLLAGEITPIPQNEENVTFSPNITREQERLTWTQTATEVHQQVRGMHPWPVAYTMFGDTRWKIYQTEVSQETTEANPGTIIALDKDGIGIACGAGTILRVTRLQPAGKGQLNVTEFLNGVGRELTIGSQVV